MCPSGFGVVALDWPVDAELRKEGVRNIRQGATKALFSRKAAAPATSDRAAEGESLEHVVFSLFPGIEPEPADDFWFVRRVVGQYPFAVECSQPVLQPAASKITANRCPWAAVRRGRRRIKKRRQGSFYEIYVSDGCHEFLGERLLILADLEYEGRIGFDVEVEITQR